MNKKIEQLKVKIFSDGADRANILEMHHKPYIKGWTTNPTLMRQEGVLDYQAFAQEILALIPDQPISFEVLSDDFSEMEQQALQLASWGDNVYVKIPITNTRRETCHALVKRLAAQHVKLNITAVMTLEQVRHITSALSPEVPCYISVFAGRIADTGLDPLPIMAEALEIIKTNPLAELIWASPRELFNIFQADAIGCHIITVTKDILKKLPLIGYNLEDYSLDTVKMFYNDAMAAGFELPR
ncbi:TPA: transaldolase [Legionella feeleii]|uniref:Transaldolase n=1 Tax=Legionella feeleii TaxID=453 RepID=A0A0W0U1G4_9GAMM|nr:transaldolase [Legionella feeleii]KTD01501.1 Transaldolase [Legionella feeleii]SPX61312.1 Transaldolase [Legionella feeleii]STX38913.1 Transaldolase [Legionella feeleii]